MSVCSSIQAAAATNHPITQDSRPISQKKIAISPKVVAHTAPIIDVSTLLLLLSILFSC